MAKSVRAHRVSVAAGALSVALLAPAVAVPQAPLLPAAAAETPGSFADRYTTANFWNANEAVVQGLTLDPGTKLEPTTNTIFNWGFRNDNGQLVLIRPKSAAAFKSGNQDIPVKVTGADGTTYNTTLKVTVVDSRAPQAWEGALQQTYDLDFANSNAPKTIDDLALPEGVTISKANITPPPEFKVATENGTVKVTPASTFKSGYYELPVKVSDGTDSFDAKLRINAKNPQTEPKDAATGAASVIGTLVGAALGLGGGTGGVGDLIGKLLGGGSGTGGSGDGSGKLVNIVITNNANNNGSNNGSNNSAVITGNANPVITGNANPVITGNANNNGSNNSAIVTGNANPTVVVTGNANPNVVITGNLNPANNGNNNGSNNSAIVTGNANPVITDNANPSLFGRLSDRKKAGAADAGKPGAGGISDPRCIASLVGLGLPLIALIPIALAQQVRIPGLEQASAQAARAFNAAAAEFGITPEQLQAAGGGAVGAALATLVAAAAFTCIPSGEPSAAAETTTTVAPVVSTAQNA